MSRRASRQTKPKRKSVFGVHTADRRAALRRAKAPRPTVPLSSAQYRLLILWFIGVLPAYGVTLIQLVNDYYGDRIDEAVGWLLSATLPTLLLIAGVVGARAVQQAGSAAAEAVVDRRFLWVALGVSSIYLLILNGVVFLQPLSRVSERLGPFEMLKTANLIIGPIQGLVGAILGALFVSGKPAKVSAVPEGAAKPLL